HKEILDNAFSWSVYQLTPEDQRAHIVSEIQNFESIDAATTDINEEKYVETRIALTNLICPIIDIPINDIRSKFVALELESSQMQILTNDTKTRLPRIMKKYLIHNQSVLTDTKFLGFPFHYFYTAVFLLVLFVFLCWLYCVRIDRRHKILNIVE
ncbi:DUF4212 domain-containing protein, partial [Bacteroidota bacterium]